MLPEADLRGGQEIHFLILAEILLYTYVYNESAIRVLFYPDLTESGFVRFLPSDKGTE